MKSAFQIAGVCGLAVLAGCMAVKPEIRQASVAARFDSANPPEAFARCAAAALPNFKLDQEEDGTWSLIRKDGIVLLSRWDFFQTNQGSQAELRNGAGDEAGAAEVRACA